MTHKNPQVKISNPHVKIVRLAATSLCVGMALALTNPNPVVAQDDNCAVLGELAGAMMTARQSGMALSEALTIVQGFSDDDPAAAALAEAVVLEAWAYPRMTFEENQQLAVEEFRDDWHLACLQTR